MWFQVICAYQPPILLLPDDQIRRTPDLWLVDSYRCERNGRRFAQTMVYDPFGPSTDSHPYQRWLLISVLCSREPGKPQS